MRFTSPDVPSEDEKEEECVTEVLTGGQIEPSDSPWSSPVVLVTKKDGGTQFCVDYRRLNEVTVKDAYPLAKIDDTLDMLTGKQWFSTLDMASGYWQVSLSQEARVKTAFATHSGLFQFRVMPFGLSNALATFGRLMVPLSRLPGRYYILWFHFRWCVGKLDFDLRETLVLWTTIKIHQVSPLSIICTVSGTHCWSSRSGVWPNKDRGRQIMAGPWLPQEHTPVPGICGLLPAVYSEICWCRDTFGGLDWKIRSIRVGLELFDCLQCSYTVSVTYTRPDPRFPTETEQYILDTDASNFGLCGVLSQIQDDVERVVAYSWL